MDRGGRDTLEIEFGGSKPSDITLTGFQKTLGGSVEIRESNEL